jgi:hypothetical protein
VDQSATDEDVATKLRQAAGIVEADLRLIDILGEDGCAALASWLRDEVRVFGTWRPTPSAEAWPARAFADAVVPPAASRYGDEVGPEPSVTDAPTEPNVGTAPL